MSTKPQNNRGLPLSLTTVVILRHWVSRPLLRVRAEQIRGYRRAGGGKMPPGRIHSPRIGGATLALPPTRLRIPRPDPQAETDSRHPIFLLSQAEGISPSRCIRQFL